MDNEEPITVLLVDDDPDFADLAAEHLRRGRDNFEIIVEYGGQKGLDALDGTVDCVVSDFDMPGMNGLAFLRAVREDYPDRPFVLFTGKGSEEIAGEAISAGVTDYLQKQTGTDRYDLLANRIENAVARRRSERAASETKSRYQTLFERHPHAVVVHDGSGAMYLNDRFADLAGAEGVEAIADRSALSFVHPDDRERVAERIARILEGDETGADWLEWRLTRVDGEIRHVESRGNTVDYQGTTASQVVIRDVTDRREREQRLEALTAATRRLLTASDHERVGEITVDVLSEILGEDLTAVWYARDAELEPLAISELAASLPAVTEPGQSLPTWSVEYRTFQDGAPRVVEAYSDREDGITDALETVLLVPLGEYGLVGAGSTEPRTFETAEQHLVEILAGSVTAAFERLADPQ